MHLTLLGTVNPVVPIVTEYATGITNMMLSRNQNVKINAPTMGLWFDDTPIKPKLCEGSYIAIQMPNPDTFEWNKYTYNQLTGALRKKDVPGTDLPYNYFVFSISKI